MNTRDFTIPNWVLKKLIRWAEKAYRRGYQHGLLAAQEYGQLYNSNRTLNFRFGSCNDSRQPLSQFSKCDSFTRHIEFDPIPGVITHINGNARSITLVEVK